MREKLIELIRQCQLKYFNATNGRLADHLIANGVTIATDNNKWIPVTERLPEKTGEHILVCYSDGWISDQYTPVDDGVTHWMPLPEPPKGE